MMPANTVGASGAQQQNSTPIAQRFKHLIEIVNADHVLLRRGRYLTADIHVSLGPGAFILSIREGRVTNIEPATRLMRPWTFAVRADAADWLKHWEDPPAPGWHDLLAMSKRGLVTIEGDLKPFMANLQYIKDVLAAPRLAR